MINMSTNGHSNTRDKLLVKGKVTLTENFVLIAGSLKIAG
jgi:hypothetical protein